VLWVYATPVEPDETTVPFGESCSNWTEVIVLELNVLHTIKIFDVVKLNTVPARC